VLTLPLTRIRSKKLYFKAILSSAGFDLKADTAWHQKYPWSQQDWNTETPGSPE